MRNIINFLNTGCTYYTACQGGGTTYTSKVLEGIHSICNEVLVSMMSVMRNI